MIREELRKRMNESNDVGDGRRKEERKKFDGYKTDRNLEVRTRKKKGRPSKNKSNRMRG